MSILNESYWQNRYEKGETGWDVGTVSTPLKEFIDYLDSLDKEYKSLKILIPGAGNGYEAIYLWQMGFQNVYICDWASDAIESFKNKAPYFPENQLITGDFFDINDTFDMVIEQTFFCAIDPILRTQYAQKMSEILVKNGENRFKGVLIGLLFSKEFPFEGPPFGGTEQEYAEYFKPYFETIKMERAYNSIAPRADSEVWIYFKK